MNRQELAERLRDHAELHGALNDDEQRQWADDLRAAADIVGRCECAPEFKMPDGCRCDPVEWNANKGVEPICSRYIRSEYGWCKHCSHNRECHQEVARHE